MRFLDPDESWKLFLKKTFIDMNTDGQCLEDLENMGREILNKCNGLPLAISVVGGLLMKQARSESEWRKVLRGINSHLGRSGSSNDVSAILELSYQNLPPQLKLCFLCLGFFKEDAALSARKLVHIWIAQGFVPQEGEETMEEIARGYLEELINRNLVQVKDMDKLYNGVRTCHIHDLLRELSIRKAKEEINFEILTEEGNSESSHKPRHRAVFPRGELKVVVLGNPNKHLRSLFVHGAEKFIDCRPSSYWKSFELLRVLDLEDCVLLNLPDAIGALTGLRYLGLRYTFISKLPSSFGRLKSLEVLDVRYCPMHSLNGIWKMDSLRHLYASAFVCKASSKINALKNLQTLSCIPLTDSNIEQVIRMTSLCKLGVCMRSISDASKFFTSLAMLENLVHLNLSNCDSLTMDGLRSLHRITQLKLDGRITGLPGAHNFPPNLTSLSLTWTLLNEDPMPALEKLPKLLYLKMDLAYTGEEMVVADDGFPKLKALSLRRMEQLENLRIGKGAMSELKRLEIDGCPELSLPREVREMSKLEELKMVTTTEIASELRGVDSHVISNIPSVHLVADPRLPSLKNMRG